MIQSPELAALASDLLARGLQRTPPVVLVTRWQALLAGDAPRFLDASVHAGSDVPGTRYTFFAATDNAICYLRAEHADEFWSDDRTQPVIPRDHVEPRTFAAWRRPLSAVAEIGLGGDPWDWVPPAGQPSWTATPTYTLMVGSDVVMVPLPNPWREGDAPDAGIVVELLRAHWRAVDG